VPRFRPHEHLRRPADFQAVYDRRRSSADATLLVYARENGLAYSRLGISVSKRFGKAVVRNRMRRLLREAFRLSKSEMPIGYDFVVIPRGADQYTLEGFQQSLTKHSKTAVKRMSRDTDAVRSPRETSS
jgi:ribonuclease P protein component